MSSGPDASFEPLFLDGAEGRLFAVCYWPHAASGGGSALIYVPPFAEEMNRARRMVALQARELARIGVTIMVLDLYGCGDSAGDFRDARWDIWCADVAAAANWLRKRGMERVGLWGLRLGGLLASEVATILPGEFERLALWQPVLSGATMLTQFLRARVAAAMSNPRNGETTDGLRSALASGRNIEVAGYELSAELAAAIDRARLDELILPHNLSVDWLEVVPEAGRSLAAPSQHLIDRWRTSGARVNVSAVVGPQFWSLQETTLAPELTKAMRDLFQRALV